MITIDVVGWLTGDFARWEALLLFGLLAGFLAWKVDR